LLVEDDVDDRFIMHHSFSELKWVEKVKMFSAVEDLLVYLHNLPDDSYYPSLIVLDFNMPGMNGAEALRSLKTRQQLQHIPVVVYSTSMKPVLSEALKISGALDCFEKGTSAKDYLELAKTFKRIAEGDVVIEPGLEGFNPRP
jgi:CheY-like chemotaxis protein